MAYQIVKLLKCVKKNKHMTVISANIENTCNIIKHGFNLKQKYWISIKHTFTHDIHFNRLFTVLVFGYFSGQLSCMMDVSDQATPAFADLGLPVEWARLDLTLLPVSHGGCWCFAMGLMGSPLEQWDQWKPLEFATDVFCCGGVFAHLVFGRHRTLAPGQASRRDLDLSILLVSESGRCRRDGAAVVVGCFCRSNTC